MANGRAKIVWFCHTTFGKVRVDLSTVRRLIRRRSFGRRSLQPAPYNFFSRGSLIFPNELTRFSRQLIRNSFPGLTATPSEFLGDPASPAWRVYLLPDSFLIPRGQDGSDAAGSAALYFKAAALGCGNDMNCGATEHARGRPQPPAHGGPKRGRGGRATVKPRRPSQKRPRRALPPYAGTDTFSNFSMRNSG